MWPGCCGRSGRRLGPDWRGTLSCFAAEGVAIKIFGLSEWESKILRGGGAIPFPPEGCRKMCGCLWCRVGFLSFGRLCVFSVEGYYGFFRFSERNYLTI